MSPIVPILKTVPLAGWLGAGLLLSVGLNYTQWANAQAADAECRAKLAEQQLQAKKAADDLRAEQQSRIDQASVDDTDAERETLEQIAAGVKRTQHQLSQASRANPSPVACRVGPDRVRVVNAALSVSRTARPAL